MNMESEISDYIRVNDSFLCDMKKNIEEVEEHHLSIFKLFLKHNVHYSENKNGIFINLTNVDVDIITELEQYLKELISSKTIYNHELV